MPQPVLRALKMLGTFFGVGLLVTAGLVTGAETSVPTAMRKILGGADAQDRRVPRAVGPVEAFAYTELVLVNAGYAVCEGLGSIRGTASTVFTPLVHVTHASLTLKPAFERLLTWEENWYRVAKKGV